MERKEIDLHFETMRNLRTLIRRIIGITDRKVLYSNPYFEIDAPLITFSDGECDIKNGHPLSTSVKIYRENISKEYIEIENEKQLIRKELITIDAGKKLIIELTYTICEARISNNQIDLKVIEDEFLDANSKTIINASIPYFVENMFNNVKINKIDTNGRKYSLRFMNCSPLEFEKIRYKFFVLENQIILKHEAITLHNIKSNYGIEHILYVENGEVTKIELESANYRIGNFRPVIIAPFDDDLDDENFNDAEFICNEFTEENFSDE